MILDFSEMSGADVFRVMTQVIVPRPIAWVLSDSGGAWNLAPFSFYSGICSDPPLVMLSVGRRPDGAKKDTWLNIEARSEFVVHLADVDHGEAVSRSSASIPLGESEVDLTGMTTKAVEGEQLPRLAGPKVAMFCTRYAIHEVGNRPQGLILGEVHRVWIDDDAVSTRDGQISLEPTKLTPLARLGGIQYAELGRVFEIEKPE